MYATHRDSTDDTFAASISDIKLLDALAADPKPSFIVQSRPRPPCRPWPVSWHNDATRTRLRLGRTHSNSNAHSPTSGATSNLDDDGDASPQDASGSVVNVTTASLASYDNDFY